MTGDDSTRRRRPETGRALLWTLITIPLLAVVVILAGIGLVAFLGQRGDWERWSSVGEAFGVVNSIVSALAVAILVITWIIQSRDLREQRTEQRRIQEEAQATLRRSADQDIRNLHVRLIEMALDHSHLADVWPANAARDPKTRSQHLYANLLLQHVWLQYVTGAANHSEMISNLRFLFTSPKIRAYWRDTADSRSAIYVAGTQELSLATAAEAIWQEHETGHASGDDSSARSQAMAGKA